MTKKDHIIMKKSNATARPTMTRKTIFYRGYAITRKYRQWYIEALKGSQTTMDEVRRTIDAMIATGKLQDLK